MDRTYVLIHGAWYGGWAWEGVAELLRTAGHKVHTPSLTGLGDRRHLARPDITLDTHADDIVNLMETYGLHDVVLVAWSYGGMVAGEVLARVTERIASVVYVDAFVPESGNSLLDYSKLLMSPEEAVQCAVEGRYVPPIALDRIGFLDDAQKEYIADRLCPQPVMTFLQKSKALKDRPEIPHSFVLATGGHIPAIHDFHEQFKEDPAFDTHAVDEHHLMILTNPGVVADILLSAG